MLRNKNLITLASAKVIKFLFLRAYYGLSYVLSQKGQQAEANALKQKARDLEKKTQNVPNNPPY